MFQCIAVSLLSTSMITEFVIVLAVFEKFFLGNCAEKVSFVHKTFLLSSYFPRELPEKGKFACTQAAAFVEDVTCIVLLL